MMFFQMSITLNLVYPRGLLLFILFINDLPHHIRTKIIIFVDDTSFLVTAENLEELIELCQSLLKAFADWCMCNALVLNLDKTQVIKFGLKKDNSLVLKLGHYTLISEKSTKFLGVYIDECLRWSDQVSYVSRKLSSSFYAIRRIRDSLPLAAVFNVYYSLVYSHLAYNILIWGCSVDFIRVFIAQKRILRMILGLSPRTSCRPSFVRHNILTAPCIYIYKCLVFIKKNEERTPTLSSFHQYSTRNNKTFSVPKHRTTKFETSPRYKSIILYNHLPSSIKSLNMNSFCKKIKSILLSKCYYSMNEYLNDNHIQ